MRKQEKILKSGNSKGNGYVWACVMVLSLLMIFTVVSEYIRIQMTASSIRDALQNAVLNVATENYDNIYSGLREGYSGGYVLREGSWNPKFDEGDVLEYLQDLLDLEKEGSSYVKIIEKEEEYRLSQLQIEIINAPFAPGNAASEDKFETIAFIRVEIPFSFGWDKVPPLQMKLKVNSGYTPKF